MDEEKQAAQKMEAPEELPLPAHVVFEQHARYMERVEEIKDQYKVKFDQAVVELSRVSSHAQGLAMYLCSLESTARDRMAALYEEVGLDIQRNLRGNPEYPIDTPGNEPIYMWGENGRPDNLIAHALEKPRVLVADGRIVTHVALARKRKAIETLVQNAERGRLYLVRQQEQQEQQRRQRQQGQQVQQAQQGQQVQQVQQAQQQPQQACPDSPIWSPLVGPVAQEADEKEPESDFEL